MLNGVLSLVLSGGCLNHGSLSLLAGTPGPMGTQAAETVQLLKADFFHLSYAETAPKLAGSCSDTGFSWLYLQKASRMIRLLEQSTGMRQHRCQRGFIQ